MNKLLVILGPTATGKTKFAESMAKRFNGELVSADSRQVYRGMDLTTGKDAVDVPMWLYDVVEPDEEFSVSHWVKLSREAILDIHKRNKLPIIIGGTGMYIHALLTPSDTINIPPNRALRRKLQQLTVNELQKMVSRDNMNNSDWHNPRRLIRRIEIATSHREPLFKPVWDVLQIGLTAPLTVLDDRIDKRFSVRKASGLDNEIAMLRAKYKADLPSMSVIGINEHAYARRQMTWFKKQQAINWYDITQKSWTQRVEKHIQAWYTNF